MIITVHAAVDFDLVARHSSHVIDACNATARISGAKANVRRA